MNRVIRIALFSPPAGDAAAVHKQLQREELSVRTVDSLDDVRALVAEEDALFDVFLVPVHTRGGATGLSLCLELRADPAFGAVPILGLSFSGDVAVLRSLYSGGADVVLPPPYDPDQLLYQIEALDRRRRSFAEELERSSLRQGAVRALHLAREGVVLLDPSGELLFLNDSAARLLALPEVIPPEHLTALVSQFHPFVEAHEQQAGGAGPELPISVTNASLRQFGGYSLSVVLRLLTILGGERQKLGTAVSVLDVSEFNVLSTRVLHANRVRALGLNALAAYIETERAANPSARVSTKSLFERIAGSPLGVTSLSKTVAALLEFLDLVMSNDITVRIATTGADTVRAPVADLVQLLGYGILEAADFAGRGGDIHIEIFDDPDAQKARVRLLARTPRAFKPQPGDPFSEFLAGTLSSADAEAGAAGKLPFGLAAARELASRLAGELEVREPGTAVREILVSLPLVPAA